MELRSLYIFALLGARISTVLAGPLDDGRVNQTWGDVRIVDGANAGQPAAPQQVIRSSSTVLTGVQSRTELLFPDRTLIRLGAETALRFKPRSRDLLLDRGTLLVQLPKFHGGARVHAGSLTASVGGATFLIEHLPTKSVKIAVLEGDLRLSVDGFLGDSIVLTPGKLLITNPDVRRIPDPVDVDLRTLVKTSALINAAIFPPSAAIATPLPSTRDIDQKIARQDKLVGKKTLIPTNLVILGSGTNIVIPTEPEVQPTGSPTMEALPGGGKNQNGIRNSAYSAPPGGPEESAEEKAPVSRP